MRTTHITQRFGYLTKNLGLVEKSFLEVFMFIVVCDTFPGFLWKVPVSHIFFNLLELKCKTRIESFIKIICYDLYTKKTNWDTVNWFFPSCFHTFFISDDAKKNLGRGYTSFYDTVISKAERNELN